MKNELFIDARELRKWMFENGDKEKAERCLDYLCWKYGENDTLRFLERYDNVDIPIIEEGAVSNVLIATVIIWRYKKNGNNHIFRELWLA